jgi:hypothetical protein
MDTNVPPESTMRFVNALTQAGKDFDLLVVPGADHGAGSPVTQRRLQDFFVHALQGKEPPDRNNADQPVRISGVGTCHPVWKLESERGAFVVPLKVETTWVELRFK